MNKRPGLSAMKERLLNNTNQEDNHSNLSQPNPSRAKSTFNNINIDKPSRNLNSIGEPPTKSKNILRSSLSNSYTSINNLPLKSRVNVEEENKSENFLNPKASEKPIDIEDNYNFKWLQKENVDLKKELENLKLIFYQAISLKYENINVLDPEGRNLSNEFLDFLNSQNNQTFSEEFNHLHAELLEYKYNLKLKEQTEDILQEEINNLQNLYTAEQLKVKRLEQDLHEIHTEITELVKSHEEVRKVQFAEKEALKQRLQTQKQHHQDKLKANEEVFKNFLNQFHDQLELKVKEYEKRVYSLQVELEKSREDLAKQKRENERFITLLESHEKETILLKQQLGIPVDYTSVYRYKNLLSSTINPLSGLDDYRLNMNDELKYLDHSINSLYSNSNTKNQESNLLQEEFKELSNKVDLLLNLYQPKVYNKLSSFNENNLKQNKKLQLSDNIYNEFIRFKNNTNIDKTSSAVISNNKPIEEIFRTNDIESIENLNISSNLKTQALSICTVKKVINERSQQKIDEHGKTLKELKFKKDNLDQKIKSIKYSIFEIEHDPTLKMNLSPSEQEQRKLELYYELDIRQSEFNDLIEEEQRLKRNHLTYLHEKDAQLARVSEEEEKLIRFINLNDK